MKHPIHFFQCFQTQANHNSGNIAAVVPRFPNCLQARSSLARDLNTPVTVFIDFYDCNKTQISFFYPEKQMALCIHGALAAGKFLSCLQNSNSIQSMTFDKQKLSFKIDKESIYLNVIPEKVAMPELSSDILVKILNFNAVPPTNACSIASVGSPKLLIPIDSLDTLLSLKPNYDFIRDWSLKHKVNGIYVYTTETYSLKSQYHARAFNPITGHHEDAATGTAAAALSAYLEKSIIIEQGYSLKTPCEISTLYINDQTLSIGGMVKEVVNPSMA